LAAPGICFSVVVVAVAAVVVVVVVVVVVCEYLADSVFLSHVPISVDQQLHVL